MIIAGWDKITTFPPRKSHWMGLLKHCQRSCKIFTWLSMTLLSTAEIYHTTILIFTFSLETNRKVVSKDTMYGRLWFKVLLQSKLHKKSTGAPTQI